MAFVVVALAIGAVAWRMRRNDPETRAHAEVSATTKPWYSKGDGSRILFGKQENAIHDRTTLFELGDWTSKKMLASENAAVFREFVKCSFNEATSQSFIEPLRQDDEAALVALDRFLEPANAEFRELGLPRYSLKPVHGLVDVDVRDRVHTLYAVRRVGHHIVAKATLTRKNGTTAVIDYSVDTFDDGLFDGSLHFDGPRVTCVKRDAYVAVRPEVGSPIHAFLSEPLHKELIPLTAIVFERLRAGGMPVLKAKGLAELTDEAVVHGLTVNCIEEKHSQLGVSGDDVIDAAKRLAKKRYFGATTVIARIRAVGRRALLDEYRRDPYAMYESLVREVWAFKELKDSVETK